MLMRDLLRESDDQEDEMRIAKLRRAASRTAIPEWLRTASFSGSWSRFAAAVIMLEVDGSTFTFDGAPMGFTEINLQLIPPRLFDNQHIDLHVVARFNGRFFSTAREAEFNEKVRNTLSGLIGFEVAPLQVRTLGIAVSSAFYRCPELMDELSSRLSPFWPLMVDALMANRADDVVRALHGARG